MKPLFPSRLGGAIAQSAARLGGLAADWRARLWRRPAPLAASAGHLKHSAAQLHLVSGTLEKRFLATGAAIEQLSSKGDTFVQLSEQLLNTATGRVDGAGLFFTAMHVVETPLQFLNDSHTSTSALLKRLRHANDRIDDFIDIEAELQRTIAPLKYIQTLFKIESAPLGENVQAMFGALTLEIEQLHDQICELFTTKFLELREIQCTVRQVIDELQAQTNSLWEGISREKSQIDQSLAKLQRELLENQQREPRISQVGKQINEVIQRIVIGLQFQDIINQKLQHTSAALARIEEQLHSEAGAALLEQACRLEAGQLAAVRQDLDGAESAVKNGVKNILARLVSADSQCLTMAEFEQLTTSADGMVQVLFDVFETLRKQTAATAASSAAAFDRLRPIGGMASDLTRVVRDFSQRIHLIGLNAQVQAAQVGNGGALEVLSARTSEISRATTQISESVARHLDELVADLAEGVKELEALQDEAIKQQSTLANEGAAVESDLHALRDNALATLLQVNTLIDEIRSESQSLTDSIDFIALADAPLAELQKELEQLGAWIARTLPPAAAPPATLSQTLQNGYTMESEREVFARVLNGEARAVPGVVEPGVELFDDFTAAAAAPPAEPPAAPAGAIPPATVVLPAVVSPPASPVKPPTHLGDNVELF